MSSKYYQLEREHKPKLVGVKDAGSQAMLERKAFPDKKKYDEYIEYFLNYKDDWFYRQTRFPPVDFEFGYVKLRKSAILTDFLYFGPSFYHRHLVSENVQTILKDFNIAPYKYYDTKLYSKTEYTDEYKFLYCPSFGYETVDFKSCEFSIGNNISGKKFFQVKSVEEFVSIREPINKEKIVLKNNVDTDLDYFNVLISPDPFISKRLRDELEKKKISGVRIIELDESKFEITKY